MYIYIYAHAHTRACIHTQTHSLSFSPSPTCRHLCIYAYKCIASEREIKRELARVREKQTGHTGRDLQIVHTEMDGLIGQ